jgi:hypothetical protein
VRALRIVVLDVRCEHRGEMTLIHNKKAIETLGADCADKAFGIGVGPRSPPRGAEDVDAFGAEHFVEDGAKPLVPVVDQVLDLIDFVLSGFGEVTGDLSTPHRIGRPIGHSADEHLSCVQVDEIGTRLCGAGVRNSRVVDHCGDLVCLLDRRFRPRQGSKVRPHVRLAGANTVMMEANSIGQSGQTVSGGGRSTPWRGTTLTPNSL